MEALPTTTLDRRSRAYEVRRAAAELARSRAHPDHLANGDESRFAAARHAMSFSKGLAHDPATGLVADDEAFGAFRRAIDGGFAGRLAQGVPVPEPCGAARRRRWEAPAAGAVYGLQGPDPQAVALPPAPALGSDELAYEMAEVYELALLRDEPLADFAAGSGNARIAASAERLNALAYVSQGRPGGAGRPRKTETGGGIGLQTAFRGSAPGVEAGPYLSQLLLVGTVDPPGKTAVADGMIAYGAQRIDQRVPVAVKGADYMVDWDEWLRVQNGEDVEIDRALFANSVRRFIATPRDLATYVHYDTPAHAFQNSCLILLGMRAPLDPCLAGPSGHGPAHAPCIGPQVQALVADVAAQALKAARFQKYNTHLRLRPEALAARIEKAEAIGALCPETGALFAALGAGIADTVDEIRAKTGGSALLPMAYQEGSPMHPSYGAGHAAVAGACVTVLKAYFDTDAAFVRRSTGTAADALFDRFDPATDRALAFVPSPDGTTLEALADAPLLTLEGELNKLAANVALGRNMAGVHFFSDYYDSLRLGEAVALGVLEEQALCHPPGQLALTVPTYDGEVRHIGGG